MASVETLPKMGVMRVAHWGAIIVGIHTAYTICVVSFVAVA